MTTLATNNVTTFHVRFVFTYLDRVTGYTEPNVCRNKGPSQQEMHNEVNIFQTPSETQLEPGLTKLVVFTVAGKSEGHGSSQNQPNCSTNLTATPTLRQHQPNGSTNLTATPT